MKEKDKKTKKEQEPKSKDTDTVVILPKGALINIMGVPSGRKDGKGEKVTVIYLAGRNPM